MKKMTTQIASYSLLIIYILAIVNVKLFYFN